MTKKKKKKVDAPLSEKEKRKQKIQEYNDKIAKMNGEKTSKEKAKEQKEKNIFSAFDDGYNFGDITKTASKFVEKEIVDKAYDMADSWKKDKNKTSEKLKYLKQGADLSAINTATNIADAPLQNIQEGAQKSKNKSGIRNFVEPIIKNLDVAGVTNIPEMARESAQIWSDPKKSVTDKILGTGLKMLNNNPLTRGLEAAGQSANIFRDADQDFKNIRKGIRKPSEKLTKIHQKEGEKFSQGFRDVDEASQSIVQQIPAATVSILSGNPDLGLAVMGTSVKGGSTYEAEQMGADLGTANEIGLAKELTEVGTEKISSLGSKWYGQGKSDDLLESVIDKKVKNKLGNYLTKKAAGVGGEILEEGISDVVGTAIDKATVDPDAKYTVKDFLHTAKITALSTIGMNAVTGNYSKKAYQKNALDMAESQRSENAQKVFEKELSDRLMEESDNGKNKLKGKDIIKITQEVAEDVANGQIDVSKIESTLGGDTYKQYQDLQNKKSSLLKEQETLRNKSMNEATLGDSERLKQIESEISGLDDTELKERLSNEVRELTKDDNLLAKSYEEKDNRSKEFIYEGTDKDTDITKATIESTKGKLNNTKKAHNLVDALIKMGNDKGVTYKVTNNEELKKMGLVKEGQTTNGVYIGENGEIYVNLDSKNYLEQIIMHETTHVLEKAKVYKDLQNLAFEFAKKNGTYETLENEIKKNYDSKDWDSELTARIVEDNLGNEDFVTELTHQKPAIVQKIIDAVKYLKKQFTAGSSEARKLNKIQYQLEQAYKKAYNEKSDTNTNKSFSTDFSLTKDNTGRELSDVDNYLTDNNQNNKELDNSSFSLLQNRKEYNLGKYEKGLSKNDRSYDYNKVYNYEIKNGGKGDNVSISVTKNGYVFNNAMLSDSIKGKGEGTKIALDLNQQSIEETGKPLRSLPEYNIVGTKNHTEEGKGLWDSLVRKGYAIENGDGSYTMLPTAPTPEEYSKQSNKDIRYSKTVEEANTTQDNQGRELSKQQQDFIKGNAKELYDNNGKIKTYYHTTTNEVEPFHVFNPVGTPGYKYGDVVVNFYTDNPTMSGSYADSDYVKYTPEATKKAKYQYEGYISMKNPYVVDSEERSYSRANIKANESATKVINVLNNLSDDTIKELATIKKEAADQARQNERLVNQLEYLRKGMDKEQQVALQIGEILDATEKYNLNEEAQERNNRLVQKILEKEGFSDFDLENLKYEYYTNIFADDLSNFGIEQKNLTLKDFAEIEKNAQSKNLFTYEIFNELIKDHANNKQIKQILDTTFDVKQQTRVLNEETGIKQYGKLSDLVYDAIEFDGTLNRKYLTKEGLKEHYVVDGLINQNTNDVIREVLEMNKNGANYDGVVFKNLYDYGGTTYGLDLNAGDVVVTFNSNQFKYVNNKKPTSNPDIRYSLTEDNQGRELTKEQQEYFKDSKAVDKNGNLKVLYNGGGDYTTFDNTKMSDQSKWGKGIYLTENSEIANMYGDNVKEVYADIKNPINQNKKTISFDKYNKLMQELYDEEADRYDYDMYDNDLDLLWNATNKGSWADYGEQLRNIVGVDGLIIDDDNPAERMMIAFNSNQVKNVDNTNPTEDADIRYSKGDNIAPVKKKGTLGSEVKLENGKVNLDNIAPVKGEVKYSAKEDKNSAKKTIKPSRKARKSYVDEKVEKAIINQAYKNMNVTTKTAQNYLQFTSEQKKEFKNSLIDLTTKMKDELTNAKTYNKVKDIVSNYANVEYNYVDEELKSIKKEIRGTKIKVPDEVKAQITDYSDFRKASRLNINSQGQSIDSVYQELSQEYPYLFSEDVQTEADMLYELSDFMYKDEKTTEKYRIPDNELKRATDKIYNSILNNSLTQAEIEEMQRDLDAKAERRTRQVVQHELLNKMGISIEDIDTGKDVSSAKVQLLDPKRLNEDVFSKEAAQKINDATVNFVNEQEAKNNRWKKKERQEIKDLGIKARSKESAAVQKYGEKEYINNKGELVKYGDAELEREFSNPKTREKIKNAAKVLRDKYDNYIDEINNSLTEMGYDPIPKRKDYFRHFYEINDKLSEWGIPFNRDSMNSDTLPTDINGLTDQFKPGKNFFASALQRTGKKTTYDAITGIDGYLESAGNLIHHTESIQRYRTLSKFIRENYGAQHGMENLDGLTDEQIEKRISDIQNNKLSKYVAWLDEQANALAGKKGAIDRSVERFFGRRVYSALNTLKSQVGSNMTGFNVRSAMTNFASAVQGASKTNKLAFLKGTISTLNNIVHDDGLIDKSNFLTNRFVSDTLSKKTWQKVANAGQIFMTGSDYFTANQIWRSKYYENLSKGMNENQAIKNADDFASRIMGDRSKGQTAEIFNSKTLGFLTQFQLEVNNQWNSILHDNKIDLKNKNKSGAMVTFQLGQLFAASYMFNNLMKSLTGSDVMFDPIDILKGIFKPDDKDKDKTLEERSRDALGKLVNQLPMASIFTGGRIPISEAFKGLSTGFKYATNQDNEYGQKYSLEDVKDDMIGSAAYWLLPTGYGQLRKTTKGLSMFDDKLPVKGSYTKKGNLRFSVDDTVGERVKASLFGQYATKHAQDYIDSGYKSIDKSKLDEMKDLKMNSTDYKKLKKGINESGTSSEDKLNYIKDLDISNKKKNILASGVMKKDIDMKEYSKYDSLNEYKYAKENPSKYQTIRAITTYDNYKQIQKDLSEIKADVDRNGKTISNSRFKKVVNYVNSLKLTAVQKAMLIKQEYPSFKQYDNKIAQYINKQNYDFRQKATILKGLGFSNYDKQIINYVKEHYQSTDEQVQVLKDMGFKTYEYNGKIYIKR